MPLSQFLAFHSSDPNPFVSAGDPLLPEPSFLFEALEEAKKCQLDLRTLQLSEQIRIDARGCVSLLPPLLIPPPHPLPPIPFHPSSTTPHPTYPGFLVTSRWQCARGKGSTTPRPRWTFYTSFCPS